MLESIRDYFATHASTYITKVWEHLSLSLMALVIVLLIGLPLGYLSFRSKLFGQISQGTVQALRVIPSLGVLFILIPFLGVGRVPALMALVILGLPPVLLNTLVGFQEVPAILVETGLGLGMTNRQLLAKVQLPLALPYILNGIKLALVEIIASATLATYIGAGGLGEIIFTGLGLYRMDLLVIGGGTVALLSFLSMIIFDLSIKGVASYEK
ncbi:ABC transporter permease [Streptococcus merionis]|uniref:ABC transporter permease n=1 Tax=Streptococcus merionis TaxID=400065 RepID=UPI0026EC914C|nr:ABC transporter permease [Streptococcus merionis]